MNGTLCFSIAALALAVSASAQAPAMIRQGNVLSWSTGAGRGALQIVSVDHLYFEADQTNEMNRAAGTIRLYGGILDGGRRVVLVQPGAWKAVWDGVVSGNVIEGKLQQGSGSFTFKIGAAPAAPAPVEAAVSTVPFLSGRTLTWKTTAGQNGKMVVTSVSGSTFQIEQTNVQNAAAGVVRMDGEIKNGKVYIYNRKWNETWIGTAVNGKVTGMVKNGGRFEIFE
ncbi:MAG: hypothetical protein P4L36_10330 [Holophaga sp.]|nr:hypothetical protein [Holophaga sp.]